MEGLPTWEYRDAESERWKRYPAEVENALEEAYTQNRPQVTHQSGDYFCVISFRNRSQTDSRTGAVCGIRRNIISGRFGGKIMSGRATDLHDLTQLKEDKAFLQAQLENVTSDLTQLKEDKAFLQAQLENVTSDLTQLKEDKAFLQAQLENVTSDLTQLKQDKASLQTQLEVERQVLQEMMRIDRDVCQAESATQHKKLKSQMSELQQEVACTRQSLLTHLPQAPPGGSPVLRTLSADDPKFHALAEMFTSSMVRHRLSFKSAMWCPAAVVSVIRIQEWVNPRRQQEYQQARWNRFQDTACTPLAGVTALKCQVPIGWKVLVVPWN